MEGVKNVKAKMKKLISLNWAINIMIALFTSVLSFHTIDLGNIEFGIVFDKKLKYQNAQY